MVDGAADGAFEVFVRSSCSEDSCGKGGFLDDGLPFFESEVVGCGGAYVDVPCRITLTRPSTYVLFLDEVEAYNRYGGFEVV